MCIRLFLVAVSIDFQECCLRAIAVHLTLARLFRKHTMYHNLLGLSLRYCISFFHYCLSWLFANAFTVFCDKSEIAPHANLKRPRLFHPRINLGSTKSLSSILGRVQYLGIVCLRGPESYPVLPPRCLRQTSSLSLMPRIKSAYFWSSI